MTRKPKFALKPQPSHLIGDVLGGWWNKNEIKKMSQHTRISGNVVFCDASAETYFNEMGSISYAFWLIMPCMLTFYDHMMLAYLHRT